MRYKLIVILFVVLPSVFSFNESVAQTCNPGGPAGTFSFFTTCIGSAPYNDPDNYAITIGNNKVLEINGDVNITGTLTITLVGSTSRLVIKSGFTLTALNIVFSGSATGKQIEVESGGSIIVPGTLDFGGLTLDIDGSGTISAGSIINADNAECANDSNCPIITSSSCDDGVGDFCDTALPVELLFFSGEVASEDINLSWATASELNFDYFLLERSSNGLNFYEIERIQGHGTTDVRNDYSFGDRYPLIGQSYYRLTTVDFDGYTETFNVASVNFNGQKGARVFPNPIPNGMLNVDLTYTPTEEVTVLITDLSGIERAKFIFMEPRSSFPLILKSGSYIVSIYSDDFSKVERIIIK